MLAGMLAGQTRPPVARATDGLCRQELFQRAIATDVIVQRHVPVRPEHAHER